MRIKDIKDKIIEKFEEIDIIVAWYWFYQTLPSYPSVVVKYRWAETELRTTWRGFREEHKFEANIFIDYTEEELSEEFFVEVTEKVLDKFYEDASQTLDWLCNLLIIDWINDSLEDEEQKVKIITVDITAVIR